MFAPIGEKHSLKGLSCFNQLAFACVTCAKQGKIDKRISQDLGLQ